MIETGYKPDGALGALYQGFNAANVDQSAELELIKQFLANQREQQMQPLDVEKAQQDLLANAFKTSDRYQTGMADMIEGQGYSNLTAGKNAKALEAFTKAAKQAELESSTAKDTLFGKMFKGVGSQYDSELPDNQRAAAGQNAWALADTLSEVDPKFLQQKKLLGMKGDQALELEAARAQRMAATTTAAVRGDKTAQEALVKELQRRLAAQEITPDQYAAELAELQNAILAAKIQPGNTLDTSDPRLQGILKPKPEQPKYTPPTSGQPALAPQVTTLQNVRTQYPQYKNIDDATLKKALEAKGIKVQ